MSAADLWRGRAATVGGMALLCHARLLIAWVPFSRWRNSLGLADGERLSSAGREAVRVAKVVERAASRLPFATKCLPRAIALSWLLRRRNIAHSLILAARPIEARNGADDLHAWVECAGKKVFGEMPGPWVETMRIGGG